jgi:penicillin G amidase
LRIAAAGAAALAAVVAVALLGLFLWLRASLPVETGTRELAGLAAPVTVERDGLGIPVIRGATQADALRGLGFVHAQERYFQMDLTRRLTAGELSELLGAGTVAVDRRARRTGLRGEARRLVAELPAEVRLLLDAYTEGVNAGLAALRARPPEYVLLRARPAPWRAEDSALILFSFFLGLSSNDRFEGPAGVLRQTLPEPLFEFLTPDLTRFDAPLLGAGDVASGYRPLPIPGPEVVDLRGAAPFSPGRDVVRTYGDLPAGSNQWALAGSRTAHGGALVANDPHLGLAVPNVWFRVELAWPGVVVRGASVAGVPGIVIGASEHVAWGFTNAVVDQVDLVVVEVDPADPGRYRTPEGWARFVVRQDTLRVLRGAPDTVLVRRTRWGPVVAEDAAGRPLALRSPLFDPGGLDFRLMELAGARTLEAAVAVAAAWRGPGLSGALGDATGRVAYVLSGAVPRRVGFDGRTPVSWAGGDVGWAGELDAAERPALVDPPAGFVYTANHRLVADVEASRRLSRVWTQPTRALRLRGLLEATSQATPASQLALQLDTRSLEHEPIRVLVLEVVPAGEADPLLAEARRHVVAWNGTADGDQPGFRILQAYAERLREALFVPLLRPALEAQPAYVHNWPLAFEPALRLLEERPAHLLPPGHGDWPAFLRATLVATAEAIEAHRRAPGLAAPWAAANPAGIRHALSLAVPVLGRWLDMPDEGLPGWPGVLRTQAPGYGASLRMVVDPARPEAGILHMPAGQSGHFLSRHYRDGHEAWVRGEATPFLAGAPRRTLRLVPAGGAGR